MALWSRTDWEKSITSFPEYKINSFSVLQVDFAEKPVGPLVVEATL